MNTSELKLTDWYHLGKKSPYYAGSYELLSRSRTQVTRAEFIDGKWHDPDTGEVLDTTQYVGWRGLDGKLTAAEEVTYLEYLRANYSSRNVRELFRHYCCFACWDDIEEDGKYSIRAGLIYGIGKLLKVEFSPAEHEAAAKLKYGVDPFQYKVVKDAYMRFRGLPPEQ